MPEYWWFDGASLQALRGQLAAAGDGACLKVVPSADGTSLTLEVFATKREAVGPAINESHPCPPFCLT